MLLSQNCLVQANFVPPKRFRAKRIVTENLASLLEELVCIGPNFVLKTKVRHALGLDGRVCLHLTRIVEASRQQHHQEHPPSNRNPRFSLTAPFHFHSGFLSVY